MGNPKKTFSFSASQENLSTEKIPNSLLFKIPLCCVLHSAMAQNVYTPFCRTQ